jgi:hypothetical protein
MGDRRAVGTWGRRASRSGTRWAGRGATGRAAATAGNARSTWDGNGSAVSSPEQGRAERQVMGEVTAGPSRVGRPTTGRHAPGPRRRMKNAGHGAVQGVRWWLIERAARPRLRVRSAAGGLRLASAMGRRPRVGSPAGGCAWPVQRADTRATRQVAAPGRPGEPLRQGSPAGGYARAGRRVATHGRPSEPTRLTGPAGRRAWAVRRATTCDRRQPDRPRAGRRPLATIASA